MLFNLDSAHREFRPLQDARRLRVLRPQRGLPPTGSDELLTVHPTAVANVLMANGDVGIYVHFVQGAQICVSLFSEDGYDRTCVTIVYQWRCRCFGRRRRRARPPLPS